MRSRWTWLACAVVACGGNHATVPDAAIDAPADAAVTASAFDGTWLMTSLTIPSSSGPVTLRRDGVTQAVRGDVVLSATGPTTTAMSVRMVMLVDGLMASQASPVDAQVTVEPDRWVVTTDTVAVFTTTWTVDHLVLDADPTDPRNTVTDGPSQIVLDRAPAWTTTTVGDWTLVSMQQADGTTTMADTCVELQAGTTWAVIHMTMSFTDRLLFQRDMTLTTYSDNACTTQSGQQISTQTGYAEEEAPALRVWAIENSNAVYQEFTMVPAGNQLTLTGTGCLPSPACDSTAPMAVVVQRP